MRVMVTPGTPVSAINELGSTGTPIMSLYTPEKLQARVDVPMAEATRVQVGMPAEVRVEALADRSFRAEVVRIASQADLQRNTLPVKVRLLEFDPAIKPDMIARVQFLTPTQSKEDATPSKQTTAALFVPEESIEKKDGQAAVWVVDPGTGRAQRREVILGSRKQGDLQEVIKGVAIGEKVVRQNRQQLTEGARVRIQGVQ